jgi:Tol biopolymer transport system component
MNGKLRWLAVAGVMAWLTTACLPDGMRIPQSELLSVLERKVGLIAYVGADYNLYVVDQSGSEPIPVTNDAYIGNEYQIYGRPVWSRDGEKLAFARYTGAGESLTSVGLWVANKDGTGLSEVHSSTDFLIYYYWAPDSQQVSFISGTSTNNIALWLVSASGGAPELLDAGQPFYWSWAPDSHSLLVHSGGARADNPEAKLSLLQLENPVVEQGLQLLPTGFKAPAFSPDGRQLLVATAPEAGKAELLLTDVSGAETKSLAEYSGDIAFTWSPDGKHIAYISGEEHRGAGVLGRLTVIDPVGKQKPIELDEEVYAFFWSPDSQSLAYFVPEELQPPTPEPGSGGATSTDTIVIWRLRVMEVKSGKTHVVASFFPSDEFMQVLPYFDQYHQSATIWSPDSKNLIVSAYFPQQDASAILVAAASGKLDPRFLAEGQIAFWSWK